jgi:hypothetical protein
MNGEGSVVRQYIQVETSTDNDGLVGSISMTFKSCFMKSASLFQDY